MIPLFKKNTDTGDNKQKRIFSKIIKQDFNKKIKRPLNQYFIYK